MDDSIMDMDSLHAEAMNATAAVEAAGSAIDIEGNPTKKMRLDPDTPAAATLSQYGSTLSESYATSPAYLDIMAPQTPSAVAQLGHVMGSATDSDVAQTDGSPTVAASSTVPESMHFRNIPQNSLR
jgi:hypothetical protein